MRNDDQAKTEPKPSNLLSDLLVANDQPPYVYPLHTSDAVKDRDITETLELELTSDVSPPTAQLQLRDYQRDAINKLDSAIAAGRRAPLLVLPTGAGKTVIAAAIMDNAVAAGKRVLFLAPRRELVYQASAKLSHQRHGLILAGVKNRINLYAPVQIASVDTLQSRKDRIQLPDFDIILVDEAHLFVTDLRKKLLERWPNALRIGLTATPTRKDGKALGVLFDSLIVPIDTADLTRVGFLVPAQYFSISKPDLARISIVAGDYNAAELEGVMNTPKLVGDVVEHWLAHGGNRRTVVFATSIGHSAALNQAFLRAGVASEHVDATTPSIDREAIFARFRTGHTQVLCNCQLASYGFDLPELSCIVLARPTRSIMLFLQMVGRGLRPAAGKRDCLVFDHSGCVHEHGFAADPREWTLEGRRALVSVRRGGGAQRKEDTIIDCPECSCTFTGSRKCPSCGYLIPAVPHEVETLNGQLVQIGSSPPAIEVDRRKFFAELLDIAREKNYRPGWADCRFRDKFGEWPPQAWLSHTHPSKASDGTRRWSKSRDIAFFRRSKPRQKA